MWTQNIKELYSPFRAKERWGAAPTLFRVLEDEIPKYEKTLRSREGEASVFTDILKGDNSKQVQPLKQHELLPGEISALIYKIGCYTVRSAIRVGDLKWQIAALAMPVPAKYIHEISVRHNSDPNKAFGVNFKYICNIFEISTASLLGKGWYDCIKFICTVKENDSTSDEDARLFILKQNVGSSYHIDTWYSLNTQGIIDEFKDPPFS